MRGWAIGAAAMGVTLAASAGAAAAATVVERTIPLAGTVSGAAPGPGGSVVLVEQLRAGPRAGDVRTSARRPDGRVIWSRTEEALPGDGEYASPPFARQPNGTWGPVGYPLPGLVGYDRRGKRVAACPGVVDARGGCAFGWVADVTGTGAPPFAPAVRLSHPDGAGWRTALPDLRWDALEYGPAAVVRDRSGRVYAAFGSAQDLSGTSVPTTTVALSAADGTILWRRADLGSPVAGLGAGVLLTTRRTLSAHAPDGSPRWRLTRPAGAPQVAHVDSRRGRITLQAGPRVRVVRTIDGRGVWATPPRDRAGWAHTDAAGRTYVAATAGPRRGLVVFDRAGRELRRFRTALPIRHAVPLAGGRVALITQAPGDRPSVLRIVRWTR